MKLSPRWQVRLSVLDSFFIDSKCFIEYLKINHCVRKKVPSEVRNQFIYKQIFRQ